MKSLVHIADGDRGGGGAGGDGGDGGGEPCCNTLIFHHQNNVSTWCFSFCFLRK
jgi:hypothetical protein